jgi:hypothetical protein
VTCLVRDFREEDLDAVAAMCDARRQAYAAHQPVFWRPAPDASSVGRSFLAEQASRDTTLAAVHESSGVVDGFVLASIVDAPPVYDPGGRTCGIDDYVVREPALWAHAGPELLGYVARLAAERGAVQCVVVTSARDEPKRAMLRAAGASVASEWYVLDVTRAAGAQPGP